MQSIFYLCILSTEYYTMIHPAIIVGAIVVVLAIIGIIYFVMQPAAAPVGGSTTGGSSNTQSPSPMSFSTCDDKQLSLSCPNGKINILDAKYGRFNTTQCMHSNPASNALCSGSNVTSMLGAACNGQSNCTTTAGMFGDPCPFIFKELTGTYTCG